MEPLAGGGGCRFCRLLLQEVGDLLQALPVPLLQGQVLPALLHELQVLPALFHQRQASPTLLYFQGCLLLAGGSPFARLNFHSRLEAQANVGQFSWQAGPAHWARALPTLHDPGLRARLAEIVAAACKTSRQPAVIDMQILI